MFSLFGCPTALRLTRESRKEGRKACPFPGCDGAGSLLPDHKAHRTLNTCPHMAVEHERYCPIQGCDGKGHRFGKHLTHRKYVE